MLYAKILVVEDDTNLLSGIRDILEIEDYHIETAIDGQDALDILRGSEVLPDLIVSDIMMPRMDGIEFLKQVRQDERLVSIPFIYLTAKGEKSDIQRGKKLGVDDYVVKPFNADDLLIAVKSRLDRAEALQRVQEGREKELKKSILTILNHEFRTPLTFVVAYADLLGDMGSAGEEAVNDGQMLTFLEGVKSGADRLRRLVENFILLVELETGSAKRTFEYRQRPVNNVETIIHEAAENALLIHPEPYTFEVFVQPDLPEWIGDEEYLRAAITHLVDNACKFSSPETPVKISVILEDDVVSIQVTDFGRGIPDQEVEKIWEMFYQINRKETEDQGAGSGLNIVKHIAELHGGYAKLEQTELGKGSVFSINIPVIRQREMKPQQA